MRDGLISAFSEALSLFGLGAVYDEFGGERETLVSLVNIIERMRCFECCGEETV
jgi:hypothetical protein